MSKQAVSGLASLLRGDALAEDDEFEAALKEAEEDTSFRAEMVEERSISKRERRDRERRREKREKAEAEGVRYIECSDGKVRAACKGTNLYGEPCGAIPLKKGTVLKVPDYEETCTATGGYCLRCDDAVTEAFQAAWSARARGGRKRRVGPDQYMREMVQQAVGLFVRPHLKALGLSLDPDTGEVRVVPGGGAKIYGESKDGDICMTTYDDVEAQQKAAERLFDRGFGKPRTQAEISLAPMGGVQKIPSTAERALEVAAVLAEAGAIQDAAQETDTTEEEIEQ